MPRHRITKAVLFWLILAMGPMAAAGAKAEPAASCKYAPLIGEIADFLLRERTEPPRFWRDTYGSDAAYLKIRYGDLPHATARDLIAELRKRAVPPQRIYELAMARALPEERIKELQVSDASVRAALSQFGASGLRQLILQDGGEALVAALRRFRVADGDAGVNLFLEAMPQWVAGIGDQRLSEFAAILEGEGFGHGALLALAVKSDLSEATALIDRIADRKRSEAALIEKVVQVAALVPGLDPLAQPEVIRIRLISSQSWLLFRPIALLMDSFPEATLLSTLLNQTGDKRIPLLIAPSLLADIQAGRLDATGAPDTVAAAAISYLQGIFERVGLDGLLGSLRVNFQTGSSDRSALGYADAAVARAALAPSVAGESDVPAIPRASISPRFDWLRWQGIAADLAAGRPLAEADLIIAAMLLDSAGRPGEALEALSRAVDEDSARSTAHEMMRRLDRRCAAFLSHPIPYYESLYRFE